MSRLFNGTSDWAKCTTPGQLAEGTIAGWVKAVTLPGSGESDLLWTYAENSELTSQPITTYDKALYLSAAGDFQTYVYNGSPQTRALTAGISAGTWHHLAITFSTDDGLRVWLDATPSAATTLAPANSFTGYSVPTLTFAILTGTGGAPTGTVTRGNIKLYQVGVWNRVLTQTEFDNLVLGQTPATAAASGLQIEILSDTTFVDTQGGTVTLTGTASDGDNPFGGGPTPIAGADTDVLTLLTESAVPLVQFTVVEP